jgi:outer membrane protein
MKKPLAAILAAFAVTSFASVVHAAAGDAVLRFKVINIAPDASSDIAGLDVDDKVTAELGVTYFVTPQWAVDVGITTAEHDVTLSGAKIGSTRILPINIIGQYHFIPDGKIRPYVGAGLNYTGFTDVDILGGAVDLENSSFGPVVQAGLDWAIDNAWSVNVDLKKAWISSDVSGAVTGGLDIDPLVYGIGVGYKF